MISAQFRATNSNSLFSWVSSPQPQLNWPARRAFSGSSLNRRWCVSRRKDIVLRYSLCQDTSSMREPPRCTAAALVVNTCNGYLFKQPGQECSGGLQAGHHIELRITHRKHRKQSHDGEIPSANSWYQQLLVDSAGTPAVFRVNVPLPVKYATAVPACANRPPITRLPPLQPPINAPPPAPPQSRPMRFLWSPPRR